ncbi:ATP-binding protein [Isoptericola aurantiacus]|uniref:ATP-binding protein n=1 Tax=Isoptericola aurantiacus TaxID=3377839 RepID=UPI00383B8BC1
MAFHGRSADLRLLRRQLEDVHTGAGTTSGRALMVSGRRRVGKSRLVQELCDRADVPSVVFQATRRRSTSAERRDFLDTVSQAGLPGSDLVAGLTASDWNQALRSLAIALPDDRPAIVVIDELPWLTEQDPELEGALQTVWDQHLSHKPVLLILVGSDLSVMTALQQHGRPFFGRARPMHIEPLHVADVQDATGLDAAAAIDAYLVTGGFPEVVQSWQPGTPLRAFLHESLTDPLSPLLVSGELSLLGEFPEPTAARAVLDAVGSGERTFSTIAAAAGNDGPLKSGTLGPLLTSLLSRSVLAADSPLSTRADSKNKRYRIADTYLRFWLAFIRRALPLAERGHGERALEHIERSWTSWRGRAVEPLVRASLERLLPDNSWPTAAAVGGWWNRQNNPEVDLVGADREPVARSVEFVGSVKWHDTRPFDRREYDALARAAVAVPGADEGVPLVGVSRSGFSDGLPLAATWGPEDLVAAWR